MTLFAAAPLVIVADRDGVLRYCYQGQPLPELEDGVTQRLLAEGMAVGQLDVPADDVDRNGMGVPMSTSSDVADPAPVATVRPANIAPKADWVTYAIATGVDPAEAEAMNKADLIKL